MYTGMCVGVYESGVCISVCIQGRVQRCVCMYEEYVYRHVCRSVCIGVCMCIWQVCV